MVIYWTWVWCEIQSELQKFRYNDIYYRALMILVKFETSYIKPQIIEIIDFGIKKTTWVPWTIFLCSSAS